ncbi:uncharacterized protein LOC125957446 isoform X3 [Anopheles darlingi]|uniref:uncharacterized protein LOC125957446 isoform X3 n=1 Tax=Anopheles darlingi TaxID=43151 RepID=UPI002100198A|nr:uncharacterized protein LOC125957446 isoform X3 [Anopheles darlingi]
MAPFKLKFRMGSGSSRSTSQEQDPVVDSQSYPAGTIFNAANPNELSSSTTSQLEQDKEDYATITNDRRALILSNDSTDAQISGYDNPALTNTEVSNIVPLSPPPSYEYVLEENRLAALDEENNRTSSNHSAATENYEMTTSISSNTECSTPLSEKESPEVTNKQTSTTTPLQESLLNYSSSCDPQYQLDSDENTQPTATNDVCLAKESGDLLSTDEDCSSYSNSHLIYQQHNNYATTEVKRPEILYKSSKQLYKAMAKECGITCKMSDQCRCLDCQSRYFDCEYDQQNEHEKTDGGLSAGTPMFISEVMHGAACIIL